MDVNRRSFLGSMLGLAASAAVAPIIKPRRSLFFFGESYRPNFNLRELQRALAKADYGATAILVSKEQYDALWRTLRNSVDPFTGEIYSQLWLDVKTATIGYDHCLFNGKPVLWKEDLRPYGLWQNDISRWEELQGRRFIPLDVSKDLGRPG